MENRNVFIVAMPLPVHAAVVSMLQDFFKIPNGRVIRDPPITVLGAPCKGIFSSSAWLWNYNILLTFYVFLAAHYDPSDNTYTLKTYADVTVSLYL